MSRIGVILLQLALLASVPLISAVNLNTKTNEFNCASVANEWDCAKLVDCKLCDDGSNLVCADAAAAQENCANGLDVPQLQVVLKTNRVVKGNGDLKHHHRFKHLHQIKKLSLGQEEDEEVESPTWTQTKQCGWRLEGIFKAVSKRSADTDFAKFALMEMAKGFIMGSIMSFFGKKFEEFFQKLLACPGALYSLGKTIADVAKACEDGKVDKIRDKLILAFKGIMPAAVSAATTCKLAGAIKLVGKELGSDVVKAISKALFQVMPLVKVVTFVIDTFANADKVLQNSFRTIYACVGKNSVYPLPDNWYEVGNRVSIVFITIMEVVLGTKPYYERVASLFPAK